MSQAVSAKLRQQVQLRAKFCCEYCLTPERFLATVFHIDHIRSRKHGGKTTLENLAYACPHCNQNKGTDVATFEDATGRSLVRLFHPREDSWKEHFELENGKILPRTPVGAATIRILDFNHADRLIFRAALADAGFYPP